MPTYEFSCIECDISVERNIKAEERDSQFCETCGNKLIRSWTVGTLSVWAPTSGGYR